MNITTYNTAKELRDRLYKHGVHIKPETLSMKTSGIFIPRWEKKIPYKIQNDGSVKWFFFYRFSNTHYPDMNVEEAILFAQEYGVDSLANKIKSHKEKV